MRGRVDRSDGPDAPVPVAGERPGRPVTWVRRHNTVLVAVAALVTPVAYLLFVAHFSTDSFFGDDWSVVLFVHPALHGHLSISQLWSQYNESRLLVGNAVDVAFGSLDHLDLRSVIVFSACLFVASYALLLAMARRYLGRLTPLPVLTVGLVWFSLADVQNALWAFQLSWYLTVFFLMATLACLTLPMGRRPLWLALALAASVGSSLSTVQGFVIWPLGLVCILWGSERARSATSTGTDRHRLRREAVVWGVAAVATVLVYLPGYDVSNNGCVPSSSCSATIALHHPVTAVRFLLALIGSVVPGGIVFAGVIDQVKDSARFELVGGVLLGAALFVLVQSWRHRSTTERFPLPLFLIGFSVLFDLTITAGRSGAGPAGAADSNRYVMANLILLSGIVLYGWAHIPPRRAVGGPSSRRTVWTWAALAALFLLVIAQVVVATGFGLTYARDVQNGMVQYARYSVNLDRYPPSERGCELGQVLFLQAGALPSYPAKLHGAVVDRLGEFQSGPDRDYRRLGPPPVSPACTRPVPGPSPP